MKTNVRALPAKTLLSLLLIAFIFLGLLLALKLSGQRQDVRPRATTNNPSPVLSVWLTPVSSANVVAGGAVDFQIHLKNISATSQTINAADVKIAFAPAGSLTISNLTCAGDAAPLGSGAIARSDSNPIELACMRRLGSVPTPGVSGNAYLVQPNEQFVLGTFHSVIGASVSAGTTITVSFSSSDIPNPLDSTKNLSNAGTGATIVVGSASVPTLTPIPGCDCVESACTSVCAFPTPGPGNMYVSPYKCAPTNSSATLDLKKVFCQRQLRAKGDTDGNGKINLVDYDYYRRAVLLDDAIPTNINADANGDGEVGTTDGMIILTSLGVATQ